MLKFQKQEKRSKGSLKIFFGMCDGVGKTYTMLNEARKLKKEIPDIAIGYINATQPNDTFQLITVFECIQTQTIKYKGIEFEELDLNAVLIRKPKIVLIDDLAHTNIPGSKYQKRYQEVIEILENGIDVYTTLNIHDLEGKAGKVFEITGLKMKDIIPDSVLEYADEVEIIDITPEDLLRRLAHDNILYDLDPASNYTFLRKEVLSVLHQMILNLKSKHANIVFINSPD